ncbi:hypothetical protein Peur_017479 [Populus x canadensis]
MHHHQPYAEVFELRRFREFKLIRGILVEGSLYLGQPLPFSFTALIWIEVIVIECIEFQRNAELDPEKRLYPGGYFDPLGLPSDPEKKEPSTGRD